MKLQKEIINDEFRMILSHAFLGCDTSDISKETWNLAVTECGKYLESYAAELRKENEELKEENSLVLASDTFCHERLQQLQSTNEELEKRIINLQEADMTHEYNNAEAERVWPQIEQQIRDDEREKMKSTNEYWKQRCEAAEENIRTYSEWQDEEDGDDHAEYYHIWQEALKKWQQLKNQEPK